MIKIIKDNSLVFEVECDTCHSILHFGYQDIESNVGEYYEDYYSYSSIKCPVCKNLIILTVDGKKQIPFKKIIEEE